MRKSWQESLRESDEKEFLETERFIKARNKLIGWVDAPEAPEGFECIRLSEKTFKIMRIK